MKTLTRFGWYAAIFACFAACDSGGSNTDGNTSWLAPCDESAECAAGMECSCGVCTKSCDSQAACADLGTGAGCVEPTTLGQACSSAPAPSGPVCMQLCVSAADCSASLSCIAGFCSAPSTAGAGAEGGSSAGGGGSAGTGGGSSSGGNGAGGATSSGGAAPTGGAPSSGGAAPDGGTDPDDASAAGGQGALEGGSSGGGPSSDASLGDATSQDGGSPEAAPVAPSGDAGPTIVTSVAAGQLHTCAVVNGGVQCWGRNDAEQLGNAAVGGYSTVAVPVAGLDCEVSSLCAGLHHTCALENGRVLCWGSNDHGQLGTDAVTGTTVVPVAVPYLTQVEAIACGRDHTCALRGGGVTCWGDNTYHQLGVTGTASSGPTQVLNLDPGSGATAIFANGWNTCALVNGGLRCWGDDTWGQLGNGVSGVTAFVPYEPPELATGVTAVAIGNGEFICAAANGAVLCSGRTFYDQTSQWWSEQHTFTPVSAPFDAGVEALSGGYEGACAIINGGAYCWGSALRVVSGPNIVGLDTGVESITTGDYHACALKENQVYCWGIDWDGQLGRGYVGAGGYPQPVTDLAATPSCPYGHCLDEVLNGDETAIDCGGECRACALGEACTVDGDCESSSCDSQSQQCVSFYCNDHHQDGDETDSDCGGPTCSPCAVGKTCSFSSDCMSGFCAAHVCN